MSKAEQVKSLRTLIICLLEKDEERRQEAESAPKRGASCARSLRRWMSESKRSKGLRNSIGLTRYKWLAAAMPEAEVKSEEWYSVNCKVVVKGRV